MLRTSRMAHSASVSPSLTLPRGKLHPMLDLLPRTSSTCTAHSAQQEPQYYQASKGPSGGAEDLVLAVRGA